MLSINTDFQDILLRSTLNKSTLNLNDVINKMTTGYKVNNAKDNAAGYSIIEDLNTKISSLIQIQQNTEDGISLLATAEGGLQEMQEQLEHLREVTMQATSGTYDSITRAKMQQEADSIIKEINRLRKTVEYDGRALFYSEQIELYMDRINSLFEESSPVIQKTSPTPVSIEPIEGIVEFQAGEEKDIVIDGVNYKVLNNATTVQNFEYSKDLSTGVLTINCNVFDIVGQQDVSHNIILNGADNRLITGDLADKVFFSNRSSTASGIIITGHGNDEVINHHGFQAINTGSGDDKVVIDRVTDTSRLPNLLDDSGNDTYYFENSVSAGTRFNIQDLAGENSVFVNGQGQQISLVASNVEVKNTFYIKGNSNYVITNSSGSQNLFVMLGNNNRAFGNNGNNFYITAQGTSGNNVSGATLLNNPSVFSFVGLQMPITVDFGNGQRFSVRGLSSNSKMTCFKNPLTGAIEFIGEHSEVSRLSPVIGAKIIMQGNNNIYNDTDSVLIDSTFILESGVQNQINFGGHQNSKIYIKGDANAIRYNYSAVDSTLEITGEDNVISTKNSKGTFGSANVYGQNNTFYLESNVGSIINLYADSNSVKKVTTTDVGHTVNINSSYNTVSLAGGQDVCSINGDWNDVLIESNIGDLNVVGNNNTITNAFLTESDGSKSVNYSINVFGSRNTINSEYAANLNIVGSNNNYKSVGDLLTFNLNGEQNVVQLLSITDFLNTNANIIGNENYLSDAYGNNRVSVIGDNNNTIGGIGVDVYNVEGDDNVINGGENDDAFVIKSGSRNVINGNNATTVDIMINHGKDTRASGVKDCTLNGYSLDVKVGLGSDKSAIINEEISFNTFGFDVDLSSQEAAKSSLIKIDDMLSILSDQILSVGTSINRLVMALEEQNVKLESMISSRSTIRDADIAEESVKYIKSQIIQQSSTTLLSISRNLRRENILGLLYGIN